MKVLFTFITVFFTGIAANAGDGGFFLMTCTSDSGRTVLSIFKDNNSGAEVPVKVNFGIDGQFIQYPPQIASEASVLDGEENEGLYTVHFLPGLSVLEGDTPILQVNFGDSNTVQIQPGFIDPRFGTYNSTLANGINLVCKEYFQEP